MSKILLIEDDAALSQGLRDYLKREGYEVEIAHNLKEAQGRSGDLIILDWMLPDGQGIDHLRSLRKINQQTPVIFLTAKADLVDKVLGLETGATDYMVKPFEPRELLARIRAHLRKNEDGSSSITVGEIQLDFVSREVRLKKEKVETTRKEFDLLALLMGSPAKVFTREELLNRVWGFENFPTTRTVDTHVLQLRQKLGDETIETVRGIGYRFKN